jgi:fumarate reductase subunit C
MVLEKPARLGFRGVWWPRRSAKKKESAAVLREEQCMPAMLVLVLLLLATHALVSLALLYDGVVRVREKV